MSLNQNPYAKCIEVSKRIRWDIDRDVIRGRDFNFTEKFLPDGLSLVNQLDFLHREDYTFMSQIQGRTYANIFGLAERFIGAKMLEITQARVLGDQTSVEALVRFTDEELKHQALFRRIEAMIAEGMPRGYAFTAEPNAVAQAVLNKSTWAVLGLTCDIEMFTQQHYRQSIEPDPKLSELWKDVFFYHWKEESQHAILDELEWARADLSLSPQERDAAVGELIDLLAAVDSIVAQQAEADANYFFMHCEGQYDKAQAAGGRALFLKAYRWQYIASGVQDSRFAALLNGMLSADQRARIGQALTPILQ